ncbi:MAG: tRNA dihydrouridine synthase DusB [Elusimicrobiota bacterium]
MKLQLGSLTLESPVIQSPMAACTDLPFRLIGRELGMPFAYLEMVSAHALVHCNTKTLHMMKTAPKDRPLGAQLVGCDPEIMGEAAARIEAMGFDLVDINLGCPVPKVTAGGDGAGSALLRQPDKASRIFAAVVGAVKRLPVTVKMRIGYSDPSGGEAVEIARRAEAAGVAAVAVHGRTREQKYGGRADYAAIGRVKRAVAIPVIGNGDVRTGADAKRLVEISGCDGVMLGRGALGNPWIYREVEAALRGSVEPPYIPTLEDRRAMLLRHLALEVEHAGEWKAVRNMRRIAAWYISGRPHAAIFRRDICTAKTSTEIRGIIQDFGRAALNSS